MNYPFWEIPYLGGGMLIGIVAILHVFVSHFAVGGGLFLALTERRALRSNSQELLDYTRKHSKFFLLVTVVFGAVSGVGIWFTIGLVHPDATSLLIHAFVWAWAIEWTFFAVEIAAILIYYSTWDRLDPRTHNVIAWIYFVSAFMSLVVINGILAFMLTPGKWIDTHTFLDGFFNPSYFPSLIVRTAVTLALAGVYAMFTGSREPVDLRRRVVRDASVWVMVAIPLMIVGGVWYQLTLPALSFHIVSGGAPVVMMVASLSVLFSVLLFPFVYVLGYRRSEHFTPGLGMLFLVLALLATATTEWVREAVRKPYIIYDYMYSNGILRDRMDIYRAHGYLAVAQWATTRDFDPEDPEETMRAGKSLFTGQCQQCHTVSGFNGVEPLVYGWSEEYIEYQLGRLDELRAFMPPFLGTEDERRALTAWLAQLDGSELTREGGDDAD